MRKNNNKIFPIKLSIDDNHSCVIEDNTHQLQIVIPDKDILIVPASDGKSYFVFEMLRYVDIK